MVAVAIPCSWLAVEIKKAGEQKETVEAVEAIGRLKGIVGYEKRPGAVPDYAGGWVLVGREPGLSTWLRRMLGDDFFDTVWRADLFSDAQAEHLKGLPHLRFVHLAGITDAGLRHLPGLTQVQVLSLGDTQITDTGLENLRGLRQLRLLTMDNTPIGDDGLANLAGLSQLAELAIRNTKVTERGVKLLQQALPNCKIYR